MYPIKIVNKKAFLEALFSETHLLKSSEKATFYRRLIVPAIHVFPIRKPFFAGASNFLR